MFNCMLLRLFCIALISFVAANITSVSFRNDVGYVTFDFHDYHQLFYTFQKTSDSPTCHLTNKTDPNVVKSYAPDGFAFVAFPDGISLLELDPSLDIYMCWTTELSNDFQAYKIPRSAASVPLPFEPTESVSIPFTVVVADEGANLLSEAQKVAMHVDPGTTGRIVCAWDPTLAPYESYACTSRDLITDSHKNAVVDLSNTASKGSPVVFHASTAHNDLVKLNQAYIDAIAEDPPFFILVATSLGVLAAIDASSAMTEFKQGIADKKVVLIDNTLPIRACQERFPGKNFVLGIDSDIGDDKLLKSCSYNFTAHLTGRGDNASYHWIPAWKLGEGPHYYTIGSEFTPKPTLRGQFADFYRHEDVFGISTRVENMETGCFNVPSGVTGMQVLNQMDRYIITGYSEEGCQGKEKVYPSGYFDFEEIITFPSEPVASILIEFKYGNKMNPQDVFRVAWKWVFGEHPESFPLVHEFDHGRTVKGQFTLLKCPNDRKDIALTVSTEVSDGEEFTVIVSSLFAPSFLPPEGVSYNGTTYRGNVSVENGSLRIPIDMISIDHPILFFEIIDGSEMTISNPLLDPLTPTMAFEGLYGKTTIRQHEGLYGACPIVTKTNFDPSVGNLTNIASEGSVIPVTEEELADKKLLPDENSVKEIDIMSGFPYLLLWNPVRDLMPFELTSVITENVFRPTSVSSNTPVYFSPGDERKLLVSRADLKDDTLCMQWKIRAEQNYLGAAAHCHLFSDVLSAPISWSPSWEVDAEGNILSRICLHDNIPMESHFSKVSCQSSGKDSSLLLFEPDYSTYHENDGFTVMKHTSVPVVAAQNHGLLEDDRYYNGPYGPEDFIFILIEFDAPEIPSDLEFTLKASAVCNAHDNCTHSIGHQHGDFLLIPKMVLAELYTDVSLDQESLLNILINVTIELNQRVSGLSVELHVILNEDEDKRTLNVLTRDFETRKEITTEVIQQAGIFRPLEWVVKTTRGDYDTTVILDPSLNNMDDAHIVTNNNNLHPADVMKYGRKGMLPGESSVFSNAEFENSDLYFVRVVSYESNKEYSGQMINIPYDTQGFVPDWITIDDQTTFKLNVPRVIGKTVRYTFSQSEDELSGNEFYDLPAVNNKTFQITIPAPFYGEGYVLFEIVDSVTGRSYRIVEEIHITEFDLSHQFVALPSNKVLQVPTSGKVWNDLSVAFDTEKPAREEDYSIGSASSEGTTLNIEGISLVGIPRNTEVPLIIQYDRHNYWTLSGKPSIEFSDDNPLPDNAFYYYFVNSYEEFTVTIDTGYTPAHNVQVTVSLPEECTKGEGLYPAEIHTLVKEDENQQLCIFSEYGAQSVPIPEAAVQNMEKIVIDYHLDTTYPYSIEQGTVSGGITLADQDCVFDTLPSSPYTMKKDVSNTDYKFCYKIEEPSRRVTTTFWETARPNQFTSEDNHEFTTHTTFDVFSTILSEDAPSAIEFGVGQCSPEMETYSLSDRDSAKAYFSLIEHDLNTPNEKFAVCLKSDWQYWSLNGPVENLLDEEYHILKLEKVSYNYVKNQILTTLSNTSTICDNCEIGMSFEGECSGENVQFKRDFDAKETETFVWPVQMNEFLSNNTFICINDEEGDVQSIPLPPVHSTAFQDKTEEGIVTLVHETGTKSTISISASGHNNCNNVTNWPTQGTKEGGITTFAINETPVPVCARALKEIEGETTVETIFDATIQYFNHHISDSGTYYLSHSDIAFKSNMFTPVKVGLIASTETCTIDSPVRDDVVLSYESGKMIATFDSLTHWEYENLAKLCIWQSQRNVVGVIVAYTNFSDPFYRFEANVERYDVDDQHMKLNIENINVMCPECVAWLGVSCTLGELEEMGTTPVQLPQSSYEHELTFEGVSYDSALGLCIKGDGVIRKMSLRMPTNNSFKLYWFENVLNARFNHGIQTDLTKAEVEHDMNIDDTVFIQNISKAEREGTVLLGQSFTPTLSNQEVRFWKAVIEGATFAWVVTDQDLCVYSDKEREPNVTQDGEYWNAAVDVRGIDGEITICVGNENLTNLVTVHGLRSQTLNNDDNSDVEAGKDFTVLRLKNSTVIKCTETGKGRFEGVRVNGKEFENDAVVLPSDTAEIQLTTDGSLVPITIDLPPRVTPEVLVHTEANLISISIPITEEGLIAYELNSTCESKGVAYVQYASIQGKRAVVNIDPERNDRVCLQHISQKDSTISEIGAFDVPLVCPSRAEAKILSKNELSVDVSFAKVGTKAFLITKNKPRCSAEEFFNIEANTAADGEGVRVRADDSTLSQLKKGDEVDICFLQSPNATALITVEVDVVADPPTTSPPVEEESGISSLITGNAFFVGGGIGLLAICIVMVVLCVFRGGKKKATDVVVHAEIDESDEVVIESPEETEEESSEEFASLVSDKL